MSAPFQPPVRSTRPFGSITATCAERGVPSWIGADQRPVTGSKTSAVSWAFEPSSPPATRTRPSGSTVAEAQSRLTEGAGPAGSQAPVAGLKSSTGSAPPVPPWMRTRPSGRTVEVWSERSYWSENARPPSRDQSSATELELLSPPVFSQRSPGSGLMAQ